MHLYFCHSYSQVIFLRVHFDLLYFGLYHCLYIFCFILYVIIVFFIMSLALVWVMSQAFNPTLFWSFMSHFHWFYGCVGWMIYMTHFHSVYEAATNFWNLCMIRHLILSLVPWTVVMVKHCFCVLYFKRWFLSFFMYDSLNLVWGGM